MMQELLIARQATNKLMAKKKVPKGHLLAFGGRAAP